MSNESKNDNRSGFRGWGDRVADGAIGALFTLLASLAFFYFTNESPNLTYESFPPSSFVSEQTERTIFTVRVANQGDAEAEEVRTVFEFPEGTTVQDSKVNTSSAAITFTPVDTVSSSVREYQFPILNVGESSKFSFLLSGKPRGVDVSVRGRGVVGTESQVETSNDSELDLWFVIPLTILFLLIHFIVYRKNEKVEAKIDMKETKE